MPKPLINHAAKRRKARRIDSEATKAASQRDSTPAGMDGRANEYINCDLGGAECGVRALGGQHIFRGGAIRGGESGLDAGGNADIYLDGTEMSSS
jgi:hypothetical protein